MKKKAILCLAMALLFTGCGKPYEYAAPKEETPITPEDTSLDTSRVTDATVTTSFIDTTSSALETEFGDYIIAKKESYSYVEGEEYYEDCGEVYIHISPDDMAFNSEFEDFAGPIAKMYASSATALHVGETFCISMEGGDGRYDSYYTIREIVKYDVLEQVAGVFEGEPASEEKLAQVNEWLNTPGSINYGFLLSRYTDVADVYLGELFYNCGPIEHQVTDEDMDAIRKLWGDGEDGWYGDLRKASYDEVDSYLADNTGLHFEQMNHQNCLDYDDETGYFYWCATDTNAIGFDVISGLAVNDITYILCRSTYPDLHTVLVLDPQNRVIANVIVNDDNRDYLHSL